MGHQKGLNREKSSSVYLCDLQLHNNLYVFWRMSTFYSKLKHGRMLKRPRLSYQRLKVKVPSTHVTGHAKFVQCFWPIHRGTSEQRRCSLYKSYFSTWCQSYFSTWCQKIPNISGCAIGDNNKTLITDELMNFYIVACRSNWLLICTGEKCRSHESKILYSTITAHLQGFSFDPTMGL